LYPNRYFFGYLCSVLRIIDHDKLTSSSINHDKLHPSSINHDNLTPSGDNFTSTSSGGNFKCTSTSHTANNNYICVIAITSSTNKSFSNAHSTKSFY
jgi:hypothetical protein